MTSSELKNVDILTAKGNTFAFRDALRKQGWSWNEGSKEWTKNGPFRMHDRGPVSSLCSRMERAGVTVTAG